MALRALQGPTGGGTPVGGTGTTNTIPRWTGPSTLGDSIITQSGTNRIGVTGAIWCDAAGGVGGVAFGMADSAAIRQTGTNAVMYFDASTTGGNGQFVWRSGNSFTERARIDSAGNFGIGTASPTSTTDIWGLQANTGATSASAPTGTMRVAYAGAAAAGNFGSSVVFTQRWASANAQQVAVGQITGVKLAGDGFYGGGLAFFTSNGSGNDLAERARIDSAGRMCIGTTTATAGRALTTVADLDVFGVRVGRGGGAQANTCVGNGALESNTTGVEQTAVGLNALYWNTAASANTAFGYEALRGQSGVSTGANNTAVGHSAMRLYTTGAANTAVGRDALAAITTGSRNTAIGLNAGNTTTNGSDCVFIGQAAVASSASVSNEIVIGSGATGLGSDTARIGNGSTVSIHLDAKFVRLVDSYTVATLPAAGTAGRIARVTDGDAGLAWGATVVNTGAGATPYLVWDNGTNWTVFGK